MRQQDNYRDKSVAKSSFKLLKSECNRREIYNTRLDASAKAIRYIEAIYNYQHRHITAVENSQAEFKKCFSRRLGRF